MFNKRNFGYTRQINAIQKKIELNEKINILELEKLLESNWEIAFEYKGEIYEIIQNNSFIELHNNCFYDGDKTKSLSFVKFTSPKEFINNAKIHDKRIVQIISEIKILNC